MRAQGSAFHGAAAVSWKSSKWSGTVSTSTFPGKHDHATLDAEMDSRLPDRTGNYQMEREERATDKAGPKMILVSLALAARLLETEADVAEDMRYEGTMAIQRTSLPLAGESFFIVFLNFFLTRQRGWTPVSLTDRTSLKSTPVIT
jgi:hypothetical protein